VPVLNLLKQVKDSPRGGIIAKAHPKPLLRVRPTTPDLVIADAIAHHARPVPEKLARALSWGADEHVLLALALVGWLGARGQDRSIRRVSDHMLLLIIAASALPHLMKRYINQTRPDRETVLGHLNGVSFSGQREDAFPSGHALHMGAVASAASLLPARPRALVRGIAVGLSLTRVLILAHWASDVVAGFLMGAALDRLLRLFTGCPSQLPRSRRATAAPSKPGRRS